jgi:hypothetical protein
MSFRQRVAAQYSVDVVRQTTPFTCGPASLLMAFQELGETELTEAKLTAAMGTRPEAGTSPEQMVATAQHFGYDVKWGTDGSLPVLAAHLKSKHPVVVLWKYGGDAHYSLLTAVTDVAVELADSYTGKKLSLGMGAFETSWWGKGRTGWWMALCPRAIVASWDSDPITLYHGTSSAFESEIRKHGIVPPKPVMDTVDELLPKLDHKSLLKGEARDKFFAFVKEYIVEYRKRQEPTSPKVYVVARFDKAQLYAKALAKHGGEISLQITGFLGDLIGEANVAKRFPDAKPIVVECKIPLAELGPEMVQRIEHTKHGWKWDEVPDLEFQVDRVKPEWVARIHELSP